MQSAAVLFLCSLERSSHSFFISAVMTIAEMYFLKIIVIIKHTGIFFVCISLQYFHFHIPVNK